MRFALPILALAAQTPFAAAAQTAGEPGSHAPHVPVQKPAQAPEKGREAPPLVAPPPIPMPPTPAPAPPSVVSSPVPAPPSVIVPRPAPLPPSAPRPSGPPVMVQVPPSLPPSAPASADDPDPARAALACGPAVFATESKREASVETRLEAEAVRFFYAIAATRIDPSSAAYNARLFGTLGRMERPPLASAKTAEIAATCDRRFPVARRTTPAVLPADPRDRNMTCSSALVFIDGALERIAVKNIPESLEWVARERTRYAARIFYERSTNAAMEGDGYDKAVNRRIQASQNIANYYRIALACRTAA